MNLVSLIDFLRDRLKTIVRVCYVLLGALVLLDVVILLSSHGHEAAKEAGEHGEEAHGFLQKLYHISETWPAFWSVFGLVACSLIIILSKAYGHMKIGPNTEIMTREDYYNE